MERRQPIYLLCIAGLLVLTLAFVDEGLCQFKFLQNAEEILNIIIFTAIVAVLPIVLFQSFQETRLKKYSFLIALVGYLPAAILIVANLV